MTYSYIAFQNISPVFTIYFNPYILKLILAEILPLRKPYYKRDNMKDLFRNTNVEAIL